MDNLDDVTMIGNIDGYLQKGQTAWLMFWSVTTCRNNDWKCKDKTNFEHEYTRAMKSNVSPLTKVKKFFAQSWQQKCSQLGIFTTWS